MFSSSRNFCKIHPNLSTFARLFSLDTSIVENVLKSKSRFPTEHHYKILKTLNESSPEELSKYNIPLAHIQNLANWKSKKGPFQSLNEVLEVKGFGENILNEFSKNITYENNTETVQVTKPKLNNKREKNLVSPDITHDILASLKTAVAIHLEPTGIGWARLKRENNTLTYWTCENFSSLPQKMMPVDMFNLAINILRKTPPGDVYIFEALNNLSTHAQPKPAIVSSNNQKIELISMLLSLINTSVIHNKSLQKPTTQEQLKKIENRVFYIRPNLPARLFRTLIGSEKVSAVTAINELLKYNSKVSDSLPYTPVNFEDNLRRSFFGQAPSNKELLAQALMLGVCFMDLFVRKKTSSYESLKFYKNKKKKSSST